jgi:hypothetical protein
MMRQQKPFCFGADSLEARQNHRGGKDERANSDTQQQLLCPPIHCG